MATSMNNPVPAGFDALPVLDLRDPNITFEGNRILAELRDTGVVPDELQQLWASISAARAALAVRRA